jgi:hypothetical protein
MKAYVVAIEGMVLEDLRDASADQSAHLRWLMQIGCYGKLAGDDQPAGVAALVISRDLTRAGVFLQTASIASSPVQALESGLNELLGSLDDNTVVLLILDSGYIISAPHSPVHDELENASLSDLAATVLELGETEAPDWLGGKSLLSKLPVAAEPPDYTEDEEDIVRKRLEGLGYI